MRLNMAGGGARSSGGQKPAAAWGAPLVAEHYLFITPPNHPFSVLLSWLDQSSPHCSVNRALNYSVTFLCFRRKIREIAEAKWDYSTPKPLRRCWNLLWNEQMLRNSPGVWGGVSVVCFYGANPDASTAGGRLSTDLIRCWSRPRRLLPVSQGLPDGSWYLYTAGASRLQQPQLPFVFVRWTRVNRSGCRCAVPRFSTQAGDGLFLHLPRERLSLGRVSAYWTHLRRQPRESKPSTSAASRQSAY